MPVDLCNGHDTALNERAQKYLTIHYRITLRHTNIFQTSVCGGCTREVGVKAAAQRSTCMRVPAVCAVVGPTREVRSEHDFKVHRRGGWGGRAALFLFFYLTFVPYLTSQVRGFANQASKPSRAHAGDFQAASAIR